MLDANDTRATPKASKYSANFVEAIFEIATHTNLICAATDPLSMVELLRPKLSYAGRIPPFYYIVAHREIERRGDYQGQKYAN
jgi:hypothetical protein